MRKLLCSVLCSLSLTPLIWSPVTNASVYMGTNNLDLRNSLNVLADAGLINQPITQFPLTWRSLLLDVNSIAVDDLNDTQQLALQHVRHYLRNAETGPQTYVKAEAASQAPWINRFGQAAQERGQLSIARHFKGDRFAARIQVNHRWQPFEDDHQQTLDGSYLAYNFGSVSASIDTLPLWWGPSQHSSLLMSTNARPLPKLRVDYSPDFAPNGFKPMHISAFWGVHDSQLGARSVSRDIVGLRAATQFDHQLTLGLSAVHQNAKETNGLSLEGNAMFALDVRKGWNWQAHHFAGYAEVAFDEQLENGEKPAFTLGGEWQFNAPLWGNQPRRHTFVVEYTDTQGDHFYKRPTTGQPYYQQEQRLIGSNYAPDSKTASVSYRMLLADGSGWTVQLAHSSLRNGDEQQQFLLQRSQPALGGLLNVGFTYHSGLASLAAAYPLADNPYRANELGARLSWEWRF